MNVLALLRSRWGKRRSGNNGSGALRTVAAPWPAETHSINREFGFGGLIPHKLQGAGGAFLDVLKKCLRFYAGLMALVALHFLAALGLAHWVGQPFHSNMLGTGSLISLLLVPAFLTVLLVWRFLHMALYVRPDCPLAWWLNDLKSTLFNAERLIGGVVVFLILLVFIGSFSFLKEAIPAIHPFSWDQTFADWDRLIHGGRHPYEWLWPLLGSAPATTLINVFYNLWFFILYFIVFITAFSLSRPALRLTFLYAFVLTWGVGGNLLATVFSSAGPVYYARLGLGGDFVPLMTALEEFAAISPVWALAIQETLWTTYTEGSGSIGGISAMPSLHVASSVLFALYGFRVNRHLGWCLTAFAGAIVLGSIHLGWHYAVDSYLGAAVAFSSWAAATRLQRIAA
jgi:hypothetical protein